MFDFFLVALGFAWGWVAHLVVSEARQRKVKIRAVDLLAERDRRNASSEAPR